MSPARARRTHLIRSRIAAGATALFVALFGVIGVRLASGHDPALTKSSSTSNANANTSTTGGATTTRTSSSSDDQTQVTTSDQPSQAISPVTTGQS